MMTPREFANLHGVAYTTVMKWLGADLLEGAVKEEMPFGEGHYYQIPATTPRPFRKPGVPKGSKRSKKSRAKKAKAMRDQ